MTCHAHVIIMSPICQYNVSNMSVQFQPLVSNLSVKCQPHVITMSYICQLYVTTVLPEKSPKIVAYIYGICLALQKFTFLQNKHYVICLIHIINVADQEQIQA